MRFEDIHKNITTIANKLAETLNSKSLDELFSDPAVFKKGLEMTDADVKEMIDESNFYYKHSEWDKAIECILFLIILNPLDSFHYLKLGSILLQQKRWNDAISVFEMASLLNPSDPRPYLYMGSCYIELNDKENAKEAFDNCILQADNIQDKDVKKLAVEAKNTT